MEKNENESTEIVEIMEHLYQYVPGGKTENPIAVLSGGDLLTVERELNGIEDRCNSQTSQKRLDGLVPCLEDFHTFGNFLAVSD